MIFIATKADQFKCMEQSLILHQMNLCCLLADKNRYCIYIYSQYLVSVLSCFLRRNENTLGYCPTSIQH